MGSRRMDETNDGEDQGTQVRFCLDSHKPRSVAYERSHITSQGDLPQLRARLCINFLSALAAGGRQLPRKRVES